MSENYVMIDRVKINLSDETVSNLKKELGIKVELELGDIVTCIYGTQIMLRNKNGELSAFDKRGKNVGNAHAVTHGFYKCIGKNIFKDNLVMNEDA